MPLRRRAWLSHEGWYYAAVLAFITGGAVLRSINLLVILAGMMIAPLILNWRLVMASLRGLVVSRKLPAQACAGEPLTVEIRLENKRRWMTSWLIVVEDWIERIDSHDVRPAAGGWWGAAWQQLTRLLGWHRTRAEALVPQVAARSTATTTYNLTLGRRGKYRFGPLRVSTRYPLGLVWANFRVSAPAEFTVGPRLGHLLPEWSNLLEAELAGQEHRDPQRGVAEGDYYGLRPWQSGDSTRWIHWRTTAKLGTPTVLQFERQRNRDVSLVLDPWLPPAPSERDLGLFELAISFLASAMVDLSGRGHSRITIAVAADEPQVWSGSTSPMFCDEVLSQLAELSPARHPSLAETIGRARDEGPSGAHVIVISPRPAPETISPTDQLRWIDVSGPQLESLFALEA